MAAGADSTDAGRRLDLATALLAAAVYVAWRLALHAAIARAGFVDGGLAQYDSFYQFAMAEELAREGRWLWFHNPFGTLDAAPGLLNPYASALRVLRPLWQGRLFGFDVALGALATGAMTWLLLRVLGRASAATRALLVAGGGLGFVAAALGLTDRTPVFWGSLWGPTPLFNQVATNEIVYHLLAFGGLLAALRGRRAVAAALAAVLLFLHPFNGATLVVALWALAAHAAWTRRALRLPEVGLAAAASLAAVAAAAVFQVYLPRTSSDAAFLLTVYRREDFTVPPAVYAWFLAPPALLLAAGVAACADRRAVLREARTWAMAGTALACLALSLGPAVGLRVVQPAHWSRVYPYVFLLGLADAFAARAPERARRLVAAGGVALALVAVVDGALGARLYARHVLRSAAPVVLTDEQAAVIGRLRAMPPGTVGYLRACGHAQRVGAFEYALLALTHHRAAFGHAYFSPGFAEAPRTYVLCGVTEVPEVFRRRFRYLILDRRLAESLRALPAEPAYRGPRVWLLDLGPR